MIVPMEKVFIYGLNNERKPMMAALMKCGCLQIDNPEKVPELADVCDKMKRGSADVYAAEQVFNRLRRSIEALTPFAPKKSMFQRRPEATFESLQERGSVDEALEVCDTVEQEETEIASLRAQSSKAQMNVAALEPWEPFDLPLDALKTETSAVQLASLQAVAFDQAQPALEKAGLSPYVEVVSRDPQTVYFAAVSLGGEADAVWEELRRLGANRAAFEPCSGTAAENIVRGRARIADLEKQADYTGKLLGEQAVNIEKLRFAYDAVQVELDRGRVLPKLLHTDRTFLCAAWVPDTRIPELEKTLERFYCYYEYHLPEEGEEAPVLLKNNKLVEPYEAVTELYSMPSYNGVDPDAAMAPFFFLFFGMMLSDAGYGLILVVAGLVALRCMDLGEMAKKFMGLVVQAGVSTIIWGLIYGSFFGDLIPVICSTFFNKTVTMPMLLDPLGNPILMLGVSMGMGVIHLFVGMGIKAYMLIKRGHPWFALFDVGFWYMVLIGLGLLLGGSYLAPSLPTVGKYLLIAGAAGIILTQGRDKSSIPGKLVGGLYSLYGVTSYFSDVLSYSRILALGLATGVISSVINMLCGMISIPFVRVITFILIFLFGHAVNFFINALGAFVHTARLQYVEFFGKFFEGGGIKFSPFRPNTKYVRITSQED